MKSTLIIIFKNSYDRMVSSRFIRVQETNIGAQIFTRERVRVIIFSHYLHHILSKCGYQCSQIVNITTNC
jgi:hypothetical protein